MVNPGFEQRDGWTLPQTVRPAAYSNVQVYAGAWAMRSGILDAAQNVFSYSSAQQVVAIPPVTSPAILRFALFPQTTEPASLSLPRNPLAVDETQALHSGDVQLVILYDTAGRELQRLVAMRSDARSWQTYTFDLSAYKGQAIKLYFGVYNNGYYGVTAMFVDDVTLSTCLPAPSPTPEPSDTPTPTTTPAPQPLERRAFLPAIVQDFPLGISGRVRDSGGAPLAGVTLQAGAAATALSDSEGAYTLRGLPPGTYVVVPGKAGYTFDPSSRTLVIPPSAGDVNFTGRTDAYP